MSLEGEGALSEGVRTRIVSEFDRSEDVRLVGVPGSVLGPREFALKNADVLRPYEQMLVLSKVGSLRTEPAERLSSPLAIRDASCGTGEIALRSGSRSAWIPEERLYLKGCRPRPERADLFFPSMHIEVETGAVSEERVPFGVLTREGVMRELLGFLVHVENGWDYARTPVGVMEYSDGVGFSLVFSVEEGFRRLESLLPKFELSLEDLLAAECVREVTGVDLSPGEWMPVNVAREAYVEAKASRLASLHSRGFFRGFLNSNIGNDLLSTEGERFRLALVDFDTFQAVEMGNRPRRGTRIAERVVEYGCVEAAKSLLPLLGFLLTESDDEAAAFEAAEARLRSRTHLLSRYEGALRERLQSVGWPSSTIERGFRRGRENPLYRSCILDLIPNSFVLKTSYGSSLSLYARQQY